MNHWRQTKRYRCAGCGLRGVLHDKMHGHVMFECPARPQKPKRPVFIGKTYEPKPS